MTYQEKKVWATMISGLIVFLMYIRRAMTVYGIEGEAILQDTEFWAKTMLLYMGVGVIVIIVIMIVLHIFMAVSGEARKSIRKAKGEAVEEDEEYFDGEDEMDRLIGLKAERAGYNIVGVGFTFGLISLAIGIAPGIMLNLVYISFVIGSMLEGGIKLYLYKRGVQHG